VIGRKLEILSSARTTKATGEKETGTRKQYNASEKEKNGQQGISGWSAAASGLSEKKKRRKNGLI